MREEIEKWDKNGANAPRTLRVSLLGWCGWVDGWYSSKGLTVRLVLVLACRHCRCPTFSESAPSLSSEMYSVISGV
jgi:hypothetical protein